MNPEATTELIWHFAGFWHIAEDYTASRLKYDVVSYHARSSDYEPETSQHVAQQADLPEVTSYAIRVNYAPSYDHTEHSGWTKLHDRSAEVAAPPALPMPAFKDTDFMAHPSLAPAGQIHSALRAGDHSQPEEQTASTHEATYRIDYGHELGGKLSALTQANVATDRDYYSDGGEQYGVLQHLPTGEAISHLLDAAQETIPDLHQQPGTGMEFWSTEVLAHDGAMASGEKAGETLAPGRYVNGELLGPGSAPSPEVHQEPPVRPEHAEGEAGTGQVAELGSNTAQNAAIIADVNEAPATLIVMGDYYDTNVIRQANILQDRDAIVQAGSSPTEIQSGGNSTNNSATLTEHEFKQQVASHYAGDLQVNVDYVDGDYFDIKALTQRNYIDDGDVSVQTRYDAYSQVATGENKQINLATYQDWGNKHYDIIVVAGDYHSANIISQVNILLDDDLVGVGSNQTNPSTDATAIGAGSDHSTFTGQNSLSNEAIINKYGETTFLGVTGDLNELVNALNEQKTLDLNAWSNFHGAASGNLNVLFVSGNYFDLNIISQVNVIADADLAVQAGDGLGLQWLSVGGNTASNSAEIIDAGGLQAQYLGGSLYEDSVLVQADLVSEATHVTQADPSALVSELVAFLDPAQNILTPDEETWTSSIHNNHDTFGHVLT